MKKEQLTLNDLCGYLPFDLKAIDEFSNIRTVNWKIHTYNTREVGLSCLLDLTDNKGAYYLKPIFRNLKTDLTREIEHNGERFVPIERLNKNKDLLDWAKTEHDHWIKTAATNGWLLSAPYSVIIELQKMHFWIYDQSYFEKKIIFDVNELNK